MVGDWIEAGQRWEPTHSWIFVLHVYSCIILLLLFSHSVVSDSLWPHGLSPPGFCVHGVLQARIPEWGAFLQGIFMTQGLNRRLLHWQTDSLPLSHLGSPSVLVLHIFTNIVFPVHKVNLTNSRVRAENGDWKCRFHGESWLCPFPIVGDLVQVPSCAFIFSSIKFILGKNWRQSRSYSSCWCHY